MVKVAKIAFLTITEIGTAKTIISVVWEEIENEIIRIKDLHGVIDDILRSKYGVDLGE